MASWGSAIPGAMPLELIAVSGCSIGKQLLKSMGWKEGQGVGARVRRKDSLHQFDSLSQLPSRAFEDGVVTFAPLNTLDLVRVPPVKDDLLGLGYERTVEELEMLARKQRRHQPSSAPDASFADSLIRNKPSRGRHAQLDDEDWLDMEADEDVDIYGDREEPLENTGSTMHGSSRVHTTARNPTLFDFDCDDSSGGMSSSYGTVAEVRGRCSDNRYPIPGFELGESGIVGTEVFPPLVLPANVDWRTYRHIFDEDLRKESKRSTGHRKDLLRDETNSASKEQGSNLTLTDQDPRLAAIRDAPPGSIFSLLDDRAKSQIERAILGQAASSHFAPGVPPGQADVAHKESPSKETGTKAGTVEGTAHEKTSRPMLTSESLLKTTFFGLSEAFRNRFTPASATAAPSQTDVGLRGRQADNAVTSTASTAASAPRLATTAGTNTDHIKKQRGRALRVTSLWAPMPLLCKRFNVAVPDISLSLPRQPQSRQVSTQMLASEAAYDKQVAQFMPLITFSNIESSAEVSAQPDGATLPLEDLMSVGAADKDVHISGITQAAAAEEDSVKGADDVRGRGIPNSLVDPVVDPPITVRPPMSLFKSIFEPESDSEDDSEEDDSETEAETKGRHDLSTTSAVSKEGEGDEVVDEQRNSVAPNFAPLTSSSKPAAGAHIFNVKASEHKAAPKPAAGAHVFKVKDAEHKPATSSLNRNSSAHGEEGESSGQEEDVVRGLTLSSNTRMVYRRPSPPQDADTVEILRKASSARKRRHGISVSTLDRRQPSASKNDAAVSSGNDEMLLDSAPVAAIHENPSPDTCVAATTVALHSISSVERKQDPRPQGDSAPHMLMKQQSVAELLTEASDDPFFVSRLPKTSQTSTNEMSRKPMNASCPPQISGTSKLSSTISKLKAYTEDNHLGHNDSKPLINSDLLGSKRKHAKESKEKKHHKKHKHKSSKSD